MGAFNSPRAHQAVHGQAEFGALAVAQPADARGQSLKLDALARQRNPAGQRFIVREHLERPAGRCGRCRRGSPESATQRNGPRPSQNSGRMYSGTKPGMSKASLDAGLLGLRADVVAVVEGHRARLLQRQHGFDVRAHGGHGARQRIPRDRARAARAASSSVMPLGT